MLRNVGVFQNPVIVDISRSVKNVLLSQRDVTQLAEHPAVILKKKKKKKSLFFTRVNDLWPLRCGHDVMSPVDSFCQRNSQSERLNQSKLISPHWWWTLLCIQLDFCTLFNDFNTKVLFFFFSVQIFLESVTLSPSVPSPPPSSNYLCVIPCPRRANK